MEIRIAQFTDLNSVVDLINSAFRPVESFFIDSQRLTLQEALDYLRFGQFLVAEDGGVLAASIYVELRGERAYFGMLSVDPARQRSGLGSRLIRAAEDYARGYGCKFMDLTVVNLRTELPPYYARFGYTVIGEEPFPDVPTKLPCHMLKMSKSLQPETQAVDA